MTLVEELLLQPVSTGILLGAVLMVLLVVYLFSSDSDTGKEPPGPKPLPVLGNLLQLDLSRPYVTLCSMSKQYGSIFTVYFGPKKVVVLTGYQTVKQALVNHAEEFGDRDINPIFYDISQGFGILFSNGENWKEMRRFALSTLRDLGMGKRGSEERIIEETWYLREVVENFKVNTNNCTSMDPSANILKFADDTKVIGLIHEGDESAYRWRVDQVVLWTIYNNLELNSAKTVEMRMDFRRSPLTLPTVTIFNRTVSAVQSFKFPGTTTTKDLTWDSNISSMTKRTQQRMYFLCQLRKFTLPQELMVQFYTTIIELVITTFITFWVSSVPKHDIHRLQRIIRSAETNGVKLPTLLDLLTSRIRKPFDTTQPLNYAISNIISAIVYGSRFEYSDPQFQKMVNRSNENIRITGSASIQLYNMFPWFRLWLKDWKTIMTNREKTLKDIMQIVHSLQETLNPQECRGIIDCFLACKQKMEAGEKNSLFHEQNLLHIISNLFAAGTETTSTTLRWGILLMAKYPHIQDQVQQEIDRVVGGRQPVLDDRKNLPYTDAVIHETQRLADIVPMNLPHTTTCDVNFQGFFIKKGTCVFPLLTSVLKDENEWESPYTFNPGHFLDEQGHFIKRDAFMPFSGGRRVCLGESLARMELFLFFTTLLQHFRFTPPPGLSEEQLDLTPAVGFTLSPSPHKLSAVNRFA
ncbi:hypothetical protein P4O66_014831 [Electrophorus voltai]|uniref:Alkylated DNA repair protein AlkB homologue 8 N-terminal domain-containing protein n=1 Tax=Electrophorus voltai TaxID=2609070 RepID=A0AAD8YNU1_9TELE|nr:hypothetical protein P4O66_014831 [Electrophorus voltai]